MIATTKILSAYNNVAYVNCLQKKYAGAEEYFSKVAAIEEDDKTKENLEYAKKMQAEQ